MRKSFSLGTTFLLHSKITDGRIWDMDGSPQFQQHLYRSWVELMLVTSVYDPPHTLAPPHSTKQTHCTLSGGFWTDDRLHSGLGDTTQGQRFHRAISEPPLASTLGAPSNARKHLFLAERWLKSTLPHRAQ